MSFASFIGILILSQLMFSSQKDCASITPSTSSDCKLYSTDKSNGFIYCCYEVGEKNCKAYDEGSYQDAKEEAEITGTEFICSTKVVEDCKTRYMNLSIITLIMLILY